MSATTDTTATTATTAPAPHAIEADPLLQRLGVTWGIHVRR
ncbi:MULTISPECIES: hypothetical protein [unclassified Acidovorax]|nr:hypothetical protein [Acidovorax sp. NO-1]